MSVRISKLLIIKIFGGLIIGGFVERFVIIEIVTGGSDWLGVSFY